MILSPSPSISITSPLIVEKALEREKLKRGLEQLCQEAGERYRLVGGESPKMRQAIETAKKAAASRSTVLLLGESGTGKEVFARAIHNWSERKHEPFIAINCVGLSKDLLESELFGHEKRRVHRRAPAQERQDGTGSRRHRVSRRSRRYLGGAANQATTISAGTGVRARRRDAADCGRCSCHRRDQPRPCRAQSKRDAFARIFSTVST